MRTSAGGTGDNQNTLHMKMSNKLIACGTSALLAAALSLQAQTSSSSSQSGASSNTSSPTQSQTQSQVGSTSTSGMQSTQPSSSTTSSSSTLSGSRATNQNDIGSMNATGSASGSGSFSAAGNASTSTSSGFNTGASTNTGSTYASGSGNQTGNQSSTQLNTQQQSNVQATNSQFATTTNDTQVTTFVQQLDAQGPAVVQRIQTQVGDLACSQDTIQNLVDALHSGKSVTIASNGKSATFNASGAHLGYGEAYIALALAAQELRNAGITGCATPEQWQAVLLGGPLSTSVTTSGTNSFASASGSSTVPGIVTLHTQGQGWGQIAQSSHVQLSQVINNSDVSLNNSNSVNNSSATSTSSTSPSPTGYSSAEMNQGRVNADTDHDNGKHKGEKKHWWSRSKDKEDKDALKDEKKEDKTPDMDASQNNNGASSSTPSTR